MSATDPERVRRAAAALANARLARVGVPPISNVLEFLQSVSGGQPFHQVMEDAEAALTAADGKA